MDLHKCMNRDGLIDLAAATQTKLRRLPRKLRDEFGYTYPGSLVAIFDDLAVDPRSGGVIGHKAVAEALGRDPRQVQRSVYNTLLRDKLRWAHGWPASNVQSLRALRDQLDSAAREAHIKALNKIVTDVSSGSNAAG